ncbi:MAG TPA: hypothetical protein VH105_06435 [Burkholderiales bacterium]|jgi:hypothetical protein|nr:hypothetical protein [Burkholderiales bacterium]
MADLNESKLPTAAYITFVEGAALPPGSTAAALLEERMGMLSGLPPPETSMGVSGAGLLLGFSHPTLTLAFARALIALARSSAWDLPPLRIGAHVATLTRADPQAAEATISGSSVDGAVRVAGLAEPNQALATAQLQTVLVHLLKISSGMLTPLGKRTTASGKTLDVFEIGVEAAPAKEAPVPLVAAAPAKEIPPPPAAVAPAKGTPPPRAAPATVPAPAMVSAPPAAANGLDAARLAQIEQALASEIGPIARVLIKQASAHLPDQNRFLVHLADAVPEPDRRRAFLIQATKIAGG